MTQNMSIGLIDVHKPEIGELTENGIEVKKADYYEFFINECPKLDYNLTERSKNESSFHINNMGFEFFWNKIAKDLSNIIDMKEHCVVIAPDEFEKFGLENIFTQPFGSMCDPFMVPLKPLLEEIQKLPDDIYYQDLLPEDNIFFDGVVKWLKFWSTRAVELYDEDAYIEFT